jgi:hypothetical protein
VILFDSWSSFLIFNRIVSKVDSFGRAKISITGIGKLKNQPDGAGFIANYQSINQYTSHSDTVHFFLLFGKKLFLGKTGKKQKIA